MQEPTPAVQGAPAAPAPVAEVPQNQPPSGPAAPAELPGDAVATSSPQTAARKLIVVLGASYGGISMTHYLLKHVVPALGTPSSYQVVLVSPSDEIVARPAMPRALISDDLLDQSKLFAKVPTVLAQYPPESVRFLHGTAVQLDHRAKAVVVEPAGRPAEKEVIQYHALVIATGAKTNSPLLGLASDTVSLRRDWAQLRKALPSAKTIVIAGGGPTGIETAGELGHYLNSKKKTSESPKVAIIVINASERILPSLRPALATKAEALLSKLGVVVRNNVRVASVEPPTSGVADAIASKTVVQLSDGSTLDADIYIPATGWIYNTGFVDTDLLNAQLRVEVNGSTLRVDKAGEGAMLYAIGDVTTAHRPAVHHILAAVPVLCNNMKRDLLRAEGGIADAALPADKLFVENTKEMQLVPIGPTTGVGAAMGVKLPGFAVKLIKSRDYLLWTTPRLWSGQQWAKP